jgi:hypothetical protein
MITTKLIKPKKLNRFTNVLFMLDMLERKKMFFPDYDRWMDQNDVTILNYYKEISGYKTIKILCFTHENETIHHWSNLSNTDFVCCIEFNYEKLISHIKKENVDYKERYVKYYSLKELDEISELSCDDYLFAKRKPYEIENEYRIVIRSKKKNSNLPEINIDFDCIKKITLNSSIPTSIKDLIEKKIENSKIKINTSTIVKSNDWIDKIKEKYKN